MPEFLLGELATSSDNVEVLRLLMGEAWLVVAVVPALRRPYIELRLCLTDIARRREWPNDRPIVADPAAASEVRGVVP